MEITNVIISNSYFDFLLKNKGLSAFWGIMLSIIIMIVGAIFCSSQKNSKGRILYFFASFIPLALFFCPVVAFNWNPEVNSC